MKANDKLKRLFCCKRNELLSMIKFYEDCIENFEDEDFVELVGKYVYTSDALWTEPHQLYKRLNQGQHPVRDYLIEKNHE